MAFMLCLAMDENTGGGVPQFTTAEYGAKDAPPCKACGQPLKGDYYQVNGAQVCPPCTAKLKAQFPGDSHAAFVRGLLFGVAGAIAGLALYVVFALGTGLVIGFVSLAVGYIVGKAMMFGSGGVGGRRYQIAAVILTYSAVSLSAVPIAISMNGKHRQEAAQTARTAQGETATPSAEGRDSSSAPAPAPAEPAVKHSLLQSIGILAMLGLASPFLDLQNPGHGLIGLVILFVGIRIAWQLTAGKQLKVVGPLNAPDPAAI
jgi:hypothetical protein